VQSNATWANRFHRVVANRNKIYSENKSFMRGPLGNFVIRNSLWQLHVFLVPGSMFYLVSAVFILSRKLLGDVLLINVLLKELLNSWGVKYGTKS
jgi:hypothetical protein